MNASSWGVSPVHPTYGPLTVVNKQHVMLATFGLDKPDVDSMLSLTFCCDVAQVNASSWGISPVQPSYGPLTVNKQHVMVATYGLVKPDDATVMTHAHTFNGRQDANLHVSCHKSISVSLIWFSTSGVQSHHGN